VNDWVTYDTWIISDTHFGHRNIVEYQDRPENHDEIMLRRWAASVGEDEPILHLGDVWFGKGVHGPEWAHIVGELPGDKYLVLGNHDRDKRLLRQAGFKIVEPFVHQGIAFTHRPISSMYPIGSEAKSPSNAARRLRAGAAGLTDDWSLGWRTNVHGHTHRNVHRASEGALARGRRYVNASIELMDYRPVRLGELLR